MGKLRGITIQLLERTQTGTDPFGKATFVEIAADVDNVLIGEPSTDDITDTLNLTGKHLAYTLAIPKGDAHSWTDAKVRFFGETFRTIGEPVQGIVDLIPLDWNKKVKVERFE